MLDETLANLHIQFPRLHLDPDLLRRRGLQRDLIFGWAIVCQVDGEDHYDLENTHIPEKEMYEAAVDFYQHRRLGKRNHEAGIAGTVDYSLALTKRIGEICGITSNTTGWLVAWRPIDASVVEEFRNGALTGFSINGTADFEPSPLGHILRNLFVEEISAVDFPGQPLATARLIKNIDALAEALIASQK